MRPQSFLQLLHERILVLDGAMGTQIFARNPTVEDFGGPRTEGCPEILNERRPRWIQDIHASYLDAGADAVETNTFGCNEITLADFGLEARTRELNAMGARLAREVADSYDRPRYVFGSMGPGAKLLTLGQTDYARMFQSYLRQGEGLLEGGADALLIETCQDLGQIKCALRAAHQAMANLGIERPVLVQATFETTGTLLLGTDAQALLTSLEPLGLSGLGLNCATGPEEMAAHLAVLSESSPFPISCLPNAGLPEQRDGQLFYPMGPEDFALKVRELTETYGLNIVGGCCGTSPDYIRALVQQLSGMDAPRRRPSTLPSVSSLYLSLPLDLEPRPILVGERTNATGSKLFREALTAQDWEKMLELAKSQEGEGAHALDLSLARTGGDEGAALETFLPRLVTQVRLPLMIDSTDPAVMERALQLAPGRCILNSIHLEDGDAKARSVLELARSYGAAVVVLAIDEEGMARSLERKLAVFSRLYDLAVGDFGLHPADLLFDPLTFTLASGDEESRTAALVTLEALREIKIRFPGVRTLLGVSNVSFGLPPRLRRPLNSLLLTHATRAGLDLAIVDAAKIQPIGRIEPELRQLCEDLLFDRRRPGYDPLKALLAFSAPSIQSETENSDLDILERLRRDILEGHRSGILDHLDEALLAHDALFLVNRVLLEAMKRVGERFGRGEMPLPFVLESAETMRAAVLHLQPHLPTGSGTHKAKVLLATVKGDVHDIGKNLVQIILSNNGYEVVDLGIKQPVEAILEALEKHRPQALGLSGLLVKSTQIMKDNLQILAQRGWQLPVLLGGAALSREYVEEVCRPAYPGPVLYAEDAFEGLRHLEGIFAGETAPEPAPKRAPAIRVLHRGEQVTPLDANGQSTWVRRTDPPQPPFWGVRTVELEVSQLWPYLDTFALIRDRWDFNRGRLSEEQFQSLLRDRAEPLLEKWKNRLASEELAQPKVRYGYFPARSMGREVLLFEAEDHGKPRAALRFPRQKGGRRLCIADFLHPEGGDVLALQLVSIGSAAVDFARELYDHGHYTDYYLFHGLATEFTEALAEWTHARIRREWGIAHRDAPDMRRLFSQGYQGSRYSFGYPACPDLEGNALLMDLLEGESMGVQLNEGFQMEPEYSTCALVLWHPQARYFSV